MARRHIGTAPLGGIIALCAILLLAPEARSQSFSGGTGITRKKCTISGTIGLAGVSLTGFPGPTVTTDENGVYSVEVDYGWTGKVTPKKIGYEFQPAERSYATRVTANMPDQDYTATLLTFTISGSAGQPGVKMTGFPIDVVSDQSGRYTVTVDYGTSYVVAPEKQGYRFDPPSQTFNGVTRNLQQDFKAFEVTFTISGSAGIPGIVMKGLPGNPVTGPNGQYSVPVKYGFQAKVKPEKEGCIFTPEEREYPLVVEDQLNQDYNVQVLSYDISGSVGMPGVLLKGFPQEVISDENGFYRVTVTYGFTGKITPEKAGWTFVPAFKEYKKVVTPFENENYEGTVVYLKVEGNTVTGNVTLAGFPGGNVVSDERGNYSTRVEYGWTGVVIPQKEGYFFEPADKTYPGVTQDLTKQDFKGQPITYEISGNVQMPGVMLKGLPGTVLSGADGSYTAKVPYNWDGTVTPTKAGFTFDPTERPYVDVLMPQTNQDYTARIIQHTITGKVLDKAGKPVADVLVLPEGVGQAESATTDATGVFEIKVDHGWKGKITVAKDGWNFTPSSKPFETVLAPVPNQMFSGDVKMITISNILTFDGEPLANVKVTAEPGAYTTLSDTTGRWRLRVPYGWSGSLTFFREDLEFPAGPSYMNVTTDIDEKGPKVSPPPSSPTQPGPTQPAPTQPAPTQPGPTQPGPTQPGPTQPAPTQPGPTQPGPTQPAPTQPGPTLPLDSTLTTRDVLLRQLDSVKKQLEPLLNPVTPLDAAAQTRKNALVREHNQLLQLVGALDLPTDDGTRSPVIRSDLTSLISGELTPKLLSTLAELSRVTNTKIAVDLTVKDEPIAEGIGSLQGLPINLALDRVLKGTSKSYIYEVQPDGTYFVFHPISNTFPGSLLVEALQTLAAEAEVSINPDPNVAGNAYANFENLPLEKALGRVLAGTPYVFQRMQDHYLVGDRNPGSPIFMDISETRHVRLNYGIAQRVKELLPPSYQAYVQAEASSTTDPNDYGTLLTVTAPAAIADKIEAAIKRFDLSRRQVLLDARVVAMERGNLVNLGVEWSFPTLQAGQFYNGDDWIKAIGIGYSADETFTNALMATLNLLESTSQADIVAHPQLISQHARMAQLRSIQEEWFMMSDRVGGASDPFGFSRAELQKIESGTVLTITPYIGDNNDITMEMAVEVSDSIPRGADSDLPIVTRRQAKNTVTVKNGGTVAVAGLTENRTRQVEKRVPLLGSIPIIGRAFRNNDDQKATREIAVFVTANLVPENAAMASGSMRGPQAIGIPGQADQAGPEFRNSLAESLRNQSR